MGYLDHSTNNIILDAVLTDYGRQQLALASSAFDITQYALGDDEVDYRLIKKYGRTVGKEKIEKNTPIFEAMTNPNIALKYKLIGRENDGSTISTVVLPVLRANSSVSIDTNSTSPKITVDLYYNNATGNSVPADLIQRSYTIKVSDRFFTLSGPIGGTLTQPDVSRNLINAGDPNRTATYKFYTTNGATTSISFVIMAKSIDSTTLSIYGKRVDSTSSKRVITSYVTVVGDNHGPTVDIPITYTANL